MTWRVRRLLTWSKCKALASPSVDVISVESLRSVNMIARKAASIAFSG
jgi:hypothetical protein